MDFIPDPFFNFSWIISSATEQTCIVDGVVACGESGGVINSTFADVQLDYKCYFKIAIPNLINLDSYD